MAEHLKHQRAKLTINERRSFALQLKAASKRGDSFAQFAVLMLDLFETQTKQQQVNN